MHLEWQQEPGDYSDALRFRGPQAGATRPALFLGLAALSGSALLTQGHVFLGTLIIVNTLVSGLGRLRRRSQARSPEQAERLGAQVWRTARLRPSVSADINAGGVRVSGSNGPVLFTWEMIREVVETERAFLFFVRRPLHEDLMSPRALLFRGNIRVIVAKRGLPDSSLLPELQTLLIRHASDRYTPFRPVEPAR